MNAVAAENQFNLFGSPYELRLALGEKVSEPDRQSALNSGELGFIHSFTTGTAVDGPGVRIVGWLAGCQFRCVYCHNPDTWKLTNGMPVKLSRALEVVGQYRDSLRTMKGGLTISGGEPLLQHRFLVNLFRGAKEMGVHTALDTNGFFGERLSDEELMSVDLVMLGFKAFTPELNKRITGMDNSKVIEFAWRLATLKRKAWFRFVVVPGFTDDLDEVQRVADFAAELGIVERVDLLPFHQMGRFKWERLNMDYALANAEPPSPEKMEAIAQRFHNVGVNVV